MAYLRQIVIPFEHPQDECNRKYLMAVTCNVVRRHSDDFWHYQESDFSEASC